MKKLLFWLTTLLLAAGLVSADPELSIRNNRFDFGWVPHSSTVTQSFWMRSSGTDTLEIVTTATKNKSAEVDIERKVIPPDDSALISLYWDVGERAGATSQYVSVFTNSMSPKPGRVILEGKVVARPDSILPVTVLPYKFELAKMGSITIDSIGFTLINHSERDFAVTTVSFPLEECELVLPDSLKAYEQAWGYVRVYPEYRDQDFIRSVTLELVNGPNYSKRLTVPIRRKAYER